MSLNLILTLEPGRENIEWAFSQLNECIGPTYIVVKVRQSLILLKVNNPYDVWTSLKKCLNNKSTPIHRVIPVDEIVDPIANKVAERAAYYANMRIPENATYRVTLHGKLYHLDEKKRLVKLHSIDAVRMIADKINRRVNLKNPDWVVYVRSIPIGRWQLVAALSVARADVFKNIKVSSIVNPLQ